MDLSHAFAVNVRMRPHAIAVRTVEREWTYAELDHGSARVAELLRSQGVVFGDHVAVQMHNRIEFVELLLGIARVGAVLVPISYLDAAPQLAHIIDDADVQIIFYDSTVASVVNAVQAERPALRTICVDKGGDAPSLTELVKGSSKRADVADDSDRTFYVGYTSGSTGTPKGVVRDHGSVTRLALACAVEWRLRRGAAQLVTMPMCHSGGLWQVVINLVLGGSVAFLPSSRFDPGVALELVDRWQLDWTVVVPTMSDDLLAVDAPGTGASLASIVSASAPMFSATKHGLLERFPSARLTECYGATETGVVTSLGHEDQLRKQRCVGAPIVGVDLQVLDPEGNPCATGDVGEIAVRSPYTMRGYLGRTEADRDSLLPSGHIVVGDLGRLDDEGHLYVVDRKNDMIITGGLNVYPAEVEEVLRRQHGVADAIVVGLPGDRWGEAVTAAIVPAGPCDVDALLEACRRSLPAYKVPKAIHLLVAMPRLVSGKNARRLVREQLLQDRADRSTGEGVLDAIR